MKTDAPRNWLLRFGWLALLALAVVAISALSQPALAGSEKSAESDNALTRTQQAFLSDQQSAQKLEAMADVPCVGGFAGVYPCENIDLLAFMPLADIGGGNGNDSWGWTDSETGKEYAIMGRTSGTSFVDISDPINPIYLGNLPSHNNVSSSWRDIKTYANHAFIGSEASGHGMQVFDLTRLRDVVSPPVTFTADARFAGFGSSHNIVINEDTGFAYGVGTGTCGGGLHMVDISVPTSPSDAGCFSADGYTHDAQCVVYSGPDSDYTGQEICFNANEDTLTIVDVTNKSAPVQVARVGYSGSRYTHQVWVTDDQQYILLDDELDEQTFGHNTRTRVLDISDLDNPILTGFTDGVTTAIDHNQYVKGDYTYQANYRAGLRVMELTDLSTGTLTEEAFFDIYPTSNSASFNGAWSTFPYYDSGVVIISGIEQGLFIVRPTLAPDFQATADPTSFEVCQTGTEMSTISLTGLNGYTGSVTLSTVGLPSGTNGSFSTNPVVVPGTSDLSLTVSSTPAGNYAFVVNGADGVNSNDIDMNLNVYDGAPGAPTLNGPSNGASDVPLTPTFTWTPGAQSAEYDIAIATSPSILSSIVTFELDLTDTTWTPDIALDPLTTYYWAIRVSNPCGQNTISAVYSFTTRDVPPVLLVDDDDNAPNVRSFYENALTTAGLGFDVWDTGNSDNEPDAATLSSYDFVVWMTGDEFGGAAGPGAAGETALASYLADYGGCLFISSQDYFYDRGLTSFMETYLGVASATSDVTQTSVTGAIPQSPFGGTHPLSYPFTNYSDIINPNGTANLLYTGNQGNAAVYKLGSGWQSTFWGFPMESLPTVEHSQVMTRIYQACQVFTAEGIDLFGTR